MEGIKTKLILAGDLGGTHIRLSFIEIFDNNDSKLLHSWHKLTKTSLNLLDDLN